MISRNRIAMVTAEALGTAVLTFGILAIINSAIGISYFVALGAGIILAILVLIIGSTSGAHVNPAVTLGMWTLRKVSTIKAIAFIGAQFLGAIGAWLLFEYLSGRPLQELAPEEFEWRVFIAELTGAFIFTFGIASALYQKYTGGKLAATMGGSLMLGILIAGIISNGFINPAVALGAQSFDVAYVGGPIIGAILGMNLYIILFAPLDSLLSRQTLRSLSSELRRNRSITITRKSTKSNTRKTTTKKPSTSRRKSTTRKKK